MHRTETRRLSANYDDKQSLRSVRLALAASPSPSLARAIRTECETGWQSRFDFFSFHFASSYSLCNWNSSSEAGAVCWRKMIENIESRRTVQQHEPNFISMLSSSMQPPMSGRRSRSMRRNHCESIAAVILAQDSRFK